MSTTRLKEISFYDQLKILNKQYCSKQDIRKLTRLGLPRINKIIPDFEIWIKQIKKIDLNKVNPFERIVYPTFLVVEYFEINTKQIEKYASIENKKS